MKRSRPTDADPYLPGHGDVRFGVDHYRLDLAYDLPENRLDAHADLAVTILERTDELVLDLYRLDVTELDVEGAELLSWHHRRDRLTVRLDEVVEPGRSLTVTVDYRGFPETVPGPDDPAGWEELTDGVLVAGQPHGAATWFPCNNRAADKASYLLTVTTDPEYTVVASGALEAERPTDDGRRHWTYSMPDPVSPYMMTLQIGRYRIDGQDAPVPCRIAAPARLHDATREAFADQPRMIEAFERMFGPYPFAGYTAVVTDDDLEIPLESASLSTFGANHATRSAENQRLIAHELAHQWFGNSITARQWRDIWLHEGFANYAEWVWSQASGALPTADCARENYAQLVALPQDIVISEPGPHEIFDDRVYIRGALTLHAMRIALGDDLFGQVIRRYVADHRHGVVSTADLEWSAAAVLGVDRAHHLDTTVLRPWLRERPLPPFPEAETVVG
ncbi:M1 family metallopeptidase [Gordonia sp. FQ]|uniref:M1 family metallopeptidase n=1 Tax=Gordonia sp. FQ TaxID=3446634 RepID=UPI003F852CFD